jgi:hypothetical protein
MLGFYKEITTPDAKIIDITHNDCLIQACQGVVHKMREITIFVIFLHVT